MSDEFEEDNNDEEQANPIYENIKKTFEDHWKPIVSVAGAIILITLVLILIPKLVTLKINVVEADSQNFVPAKINLYIDGELKESKEATLDSYPLIFNSMQAGKELEFEVIPSNGLGKTTKYYTPTQDDLQNVQLLTYRNYNVNLEINPDKITIGRGCTDQVVASVKNNEATPKQIQVYVPETGFTDDFYLKNSDTRIIPINVPKDTKEDALNYEVKIKYTKISSKLTLKLVNPGKLDVDSQQITCSGQELCSSKIKLSNSGDSSIIIYPVKKQGNISNYINFDDPSITLNNILLPPGTSKTIFLTIPTGAKGKRGSIIFTSSCTPQKEITVEFN